MKRLLYFILLLTCFTVNAQEVKVYVPLRTYHWNRDEDMLKEYSGTEGGNIGAVVITRFHKDKMFHDIQTGVVRNSFGNTAILVQYGIGVELKKDLTFSLNAGLISGYSRLYEINPALKDIFPKIMNSNGIVPSLVVSTSYKIVTLNISPTFINCGLTFTLQR